MAAMEDPDLVPFITEDLNSIHDILVYNKDVNQELTHGFTPLMIASLYGQFETVQKLVDAGADINKTCNNKTALMLAAPISCFELERVFTRRALFSVTSEMGGDTLFTWSDSIDDKESLLKRILENKTKIIECLLQAEADPNIRDEKGKNVFILVTANSLSKCLGSMFQGPVPVMIQTVANTELVKRCQYLIKHGVDINTTDSDGMTALMHAVRNRLDNICELLLDYNADVNIVDKSSNTGLTYSVLTGSKHLFRFLLQSDRNAGALDDLRQSIPDHKLLERSFEMCKLLNGDDTNMDLSNVNDTHRTTSDYMNNSPYPVTDDLNNDLGHAILLSAVTKKCFEVCKFALVHGANPKTKYNDKTVLMHAILVRSVDICNLLLHHGAEPHLSDAVGKTVLMYAVSQDLPEFADVLISYYGEDVNLQDFTGTTALMYAITCKVDDCCQMLLRHGADVNIHNNIGRTALMFAASTNYDRGIQWLTENKADLNVQDVTGRTALMYAAMNNLTQSCKLLAESKADLNIQYEDGMTAVLYCAKKSLMDPLRVLLSGGANPDLCDNKGMSALMYTIVNDSPDCCKLLVDHGANVNMQDPYGKTALMFCSIKNVNNLAQSCKLFVESKADLNIQDKDGMTAVLYCARENLMDPLKVLLSGGTNPDLCDNKGMSALMITVVNNSPDCCKMLVDHGANVNIQNPYGETALMFCVTEDSEELLKILLSGGANLEIKDKSGCTALWKAVQNNKPEFCKLLVDHGADVNSQDTSGTTPVMLCLDRYHFNKDCLDILLTGKPDLNLVNKKHETALLKASCKNLPDICELLVCHGADVNIRDMMGRTAMMHAVLKGSYECVKYLLSLGVDPIEKTDKQDEKALLLNAACRNWPNICEILVCHGAYVNIKDMTGMSAMMYAVLENSYKCVEYFLSLGVDPNEQIGHAYVLRGYPYDDLNVTLQDLGRDKSVFQLAVILDSDEMCRLMMSYGADVNKQDRDGRTALMYAVLHDSSRCFPFLLECADLKVEDNEGRTVMSYATESDYLQKLQQMGLEDRVMGEGEKISVLSLLMTNVNFFTQLQNPYFSKLSRTLFRVESVLENGANPILERCECILLHKCNISLLPPPNITKCFHIRWCITKKRKQLLRLLVCNGVVPPSGTVIQAVLQSGDKGIFKYLIANCYLTDKGVACMRNAVRYPERIRYTLDNNDYNDDNNDNMQVPEEMFQHPWPLVKLAFISVSTALGGGPGREARVSKTGLPVRLQDMLMFRQPAAQIPVREWADIELCFDPVKYEELPKPRPLLYFWPLGGQVCRPAVSTTALRLSNESERGRTAVVNRRVTPVIPIPVIPNNYRRKRIPRIPWDPEILFE